MNTNSNNSQDPPSNSNRDASSQPRAFPPPDDTNWAEFSDAFQANVAEPSRKALHDFFYPSRLQQQQNNSRSVRQENDIPYSNATGTRDESSSSAERRLSSANDRQTNNNTSGSPRHQISSPRQTPIELDPEVMDQERQDKAFILRFWTTYDDIIILSLFTQIGIFCRLGTAWVFRIVDSVFRHDSALFTNLPLNCLSCFVMGMLCSGESLMEIISTRFTPPRLQQDLHSEARSQELLVVTGEDSIQDLPNSPSSSITSPRWRGRRRKKTNARASGWKPRDGDLQSELREVQLLALERRIRASPCLVLFHVRKEDVDVVENYFNEEYHHNDTGDTQEEKQPGSTEDLERFDLDDHDLTLDVEVDPTTTSRRTAPKVLPKTTPAAATSEESLPNENQDVSSDGVARGGSPRRTVSIRSAGNYAQVGTDAETTTESSTNNAVAGTEQEQSPDFDQIISNVATDVSQQISRMSRVSLADGWDVGTSPEEKSKDLMLGLRDGLCGALSSFSSWISSMVSLLKGGKIGEAVVGLVIGIQLPIVAYRFGQHIAVYIFVWRCKRETRRDERRGYGIRLSTDEDRSDHDLGPVESMQSTDSMDALTPNAIAPNGLEEDSETPSVRAAITALFILALVAQITSLNFYREPEDRLIALSLLFSPLGVLTRWRLSKFNKWRPSFPIGTFACNISACALSGTMGSLLAGNPGPRERIELVALIAGFGGTLSSVARFIVEVLAGVDPILFRVDGSYYAIISVCSGLVVSFVFTASVDWADNTEKS